MKRALTTLLIPAVLIAAGCSLRRPAETNLRGGTAIPAEPGFSEPASENRAELVPAVTEYFDQRKHAVLSGDMAVLWSRYPELRQSPDPTRGINAEESFVGWMHDLKPTEGTITPEHYEPMKVKLDGDAAQVILHGLELYKTATSDGAGGEFHLKLYLERRQSGWTVVRTDEVTDGELHALLDSAVNCGTEEQQHGRNRNQAGRDCLQQAVENGQSATFVTSILTTEGDPIFTTVNVEAKDRIIVSVDTRQDGFGEQKVTTYTCKGLELRQGTGDPQQEFFVFTGCTGGPNQEVPL